MHVISIVKTSLNWFPGYARVCVFVFWQDYFPLITILFCAIWASLTEWPTCDHLWYLFSLWSLQTGWVHSNVSIYDKAHNYIMRVSVFLLALRKKERIWGNIPTKETIEIFIQRSLRGLQHVEPTPISEFWMAPTKISNQSMVTAQWQFIIRLTENSNETKTHQWPSVPDYGQAHKTYSGVKLVLGT